LYLDKEKVKALAKLAATTGYTQQALLRQAVDDLLARHKVLKASKRPK
jgi:predicted transcriptional regulator